MPNIDLQRTNYDTVIVGAGPAGLFGAYEIAAQDGTDASVALLDKGVSLDNRHCPYGDLRVCTCRNCTVNEGLLGAGLFSDGKLALHPEVMEVGKLGLATAVEVDELIGYTERLLERWGLDSPVYPTSDDAAVQLAEQVAQRQLGGGFELQIKKRTRHIGSDRLPGLVTRMLDNVHELGDVDVRLRSEVTAIEQSGDEFALTVKQNALTRRFRAQQVIMALGRRGSYQTREILDQFGIPYGYDYARIGGRVEIPFEVMEGVTDVTYNPCFRQKDGDGPATFTFCANPKGFLAIESLIPGVAGINGEAREGVKTEFTNFAVLTEVPAAADENPNDVLAALLHDRFHTTVPLAQTTADFVAGTTADERREHRSTLPTFEYANVAKLFPPEVTREIGSLLMRINEICPGVISHDALFVAPEAKISGIQVQPVNKNLETTVSGLHIVGDASGLSRNIVAAAITGILAARGR